MGNRLKNTIRDFFQQADLVLLGLCVGATLFGLVLIYSCTRYMDRSDALKMLLVQTVAMGLGILAYFILSMVDTEELIRHWKWFFAFNVGFICLLVPFGRERYGNKAWIQFNWMPMAIQPTEIVKITFILLLAWQFQRVWERERNLTTLRAAIQPTAHVAFMLGLIFVITKDMGSALVYVGVFLAMALAAGMAWRWFVVGLGGFAGVCLAAYKLDLIPSYMLDRFRVVLDHSYDTAGKGYQQIRGMLAIGSGGLFGQGYMQGTQTQAGEGSLPARHTDFIFCVCGEELGMIGCLVVIALLAAIIIRVLLVARRAETPFHCYVCVGVAAMLIFQTVVNIGMCLFVMPVIGLTLPFFSYGGSSLLTLYAAMGVVSGIKKRSPVVRRPGRPLG